MKKLLALIALLTCFIGANAVEITDAYIDFSTVTEIPRFGWGGSESAFARLSLENGCLHFHSDEATDPTWDCQWFPIGGVDAEVGVTYTLHFKVKGDHNENISALGFGQNPYGQFPITTEWVEGTFDYECTSADGNILMQAGGYIGSFDIAYLKITHEGQEEKPVEWIDMLNNGDAEKSWAELGMDQVVWNDEENNYRVSAWGKTKGRNEDATLAGSYNPFPADIEDDGTGNHVFVVHGAVADTPDGDDGSKPSEWDNQFWIEAPRMFKAGEQFMVKFRYKASMPATAQTQFHYQNPSNYLYYQAIGDVKFTTEWQQFEQKVTIPDAGDKGWSIAFNLNYDVKDAVDFYFDDISWCEMKLEHGYYVTAANTETAEVEYDFENATKMEYSEEAGDGQGGFTAIVGTQGNEKSWVNEVMISTVRGNDRAYKSNTLKASPINEDWANFSESSNAKIKLPAEGVYEITINTEYGMMYFRQIEGKPIPVPITIVPNPTEIIVKAKEREYTETEFNNGLVPEGYIFKVDDQGNNIYGQPWDNQFFIMANRPLDKGEETVVEFDYVATQEARTSTQSHGEPGAYMHYACIEDVNFPTELSHFTYAFTIPSEANGMKTIAFNMAEIKEACDYTITNVVWKTADDRESLIDMEGTKNFYVKEGTGDAIHQYGTTPGGLKGDANNDGVVDVADITAIAAHILGATPETWNADNADANADGSIDVADITFVAGIILGA